MCLFISAHPDKDVVRSVFNALQTPGAAAVIQLEEIRQWDVPQCTQQTLAAALHVTKTTNPEWYIWKRREGGGKKIKTYIIQVDNSPFRVSVDQRAHQMGAAVGAEKFETVHLRPTGLYLGRDSISPHMSVPFMSRRRHELTTLHCLYVNTTEITSHKQRFLHLLVR